MSRTIEEGGGERFGGEPLTVPTRWVKFIVGVFLLPAAWVFAQAFFNVFTLTTIQHAFWLTEEFWFFSLGVLLWLIVFFGLPRPVVMYVFGHELTHAVWVWAMGGRVSRFRVGRDGGQIVTDTSNFWIALAPYFFPIYSILVIAVYGVASLFTDMYPFRRVLFALIGGTWGFHLAFTVWMIPKGQSDLTEHGHFFSLVVIFLMNLAVLTVFLVLACPHISWAGFGAEILQEAMEFSSGVVGLLERTLGRWI